MFDPTACPNSTNYQSSTGQKAPKYPYQIPDTGSSRMIPTTPKPSPLAGNVRLDIDRKALEQAVKPKVSSGKTTN